MAIARGMSTQARAHWPCVLCVVAPIDVSVGVTVARRLACRGPSVLLVVHGQQWKRGAVGGGCLQVRGNPAHLHHALRTVEHTLHLGAVTGTHR